MQGIDKPQATSHPIVLLSCLKGGLGNQLFQHIFAVGMARKLNADLVTDISSFEVDAYGRQGYRWYLPADGRFGTASQHLGRGCYSIQDGQIQSITDTLNMPSDIRTLVLSGYWQKESLLDRSIVLETYEQLTEAALKVVPVDVVNHIKRSENSVAIHIRRHDYGHHGLCKESYYYAAVEYLQRNFTNVEIFVFTDEPNYARHLMASRGLQFTSVASGSDSGDLYLMSLCKHFVIANSSYSWWGAYFGEAKGGVIFCPKEWVMIGALPSPCPSRWVNVEDAVVPFKIHEPDIKRHAEAIQADLLAQSQPSGGAEKAEAGSPKPYSNLIDIALFFQQMKDYVIIKLPDHFPNYYDYQDIDIVCSDVDATYAHILQVAQPYINQGFRVELHKDDQHFHVDVYAPGAARLNFRFDLIASLAIYEKFVVNPVFHQAVLSARQKIKKNNVEIFVPSEEYELAIRCMEYLEWNEKIPSKKKHLDYIMAKNNNKFLPIIAQYTNLVLPPSISPTLGEKSVVAIPGGSVPRYDYFMIWGHGLQHTNQILEVIRSDAHLEIITVVKKNIENVASFVPDVYACDTVPFHHLMEKTRYLLTTPSQIVFVLVLNRDPQEMYFGEGPFRHIQSKRIKNVKEEIRNKFNPRHENGQRTENHVIHASDYPSQVEHLLSVLKLPPLSHYQIDPHPSIDAPYHLGRLESLQVVDVDVNSLYASILGRGLMKIKDTPHYKYVVGDKMEYLEYHLNHFGAALTDDHLPESFDKKIGDFKYGKEVKPGKRNLILVKKLQDGRLQILDGVHRAAILVSRGASSIEVAMVA